MARLMAASQSEMRALTFRTFSFGEPRDRERDRKEDMGVCGRIGAGVLVWNLEIRRPEFFGDTVRVQPRTWESATSQQTSTDEKLGGRWVGALLSCTGNQSVVRRNDKSEPKSLLSQIHAGP